ncbi:hypothetical protein BKA65DRAFT_510201 [Rhexocercosporidium sp. MPI-PUGE-AT-0058]|nr:hypothetical protein BKA65DRAFT_510201 [Rhexocercosporidium sp. MPI-PUGE-AT-0058]
MSYLSAAPAAGSQQQPPNHPTIQELRDVQSHIQELPGKLGFIWPLDGPLDNTAILIKQGPAAPEPYYSATTSQYHSLANSSLTEPKISSITVRATELELWEDNWLERHAQHSDPHADDNGPDVELRAFPDWDPNVDEGEMQLVKCYGESRPRVKQASFTATPARDGQGFVTIHDYLSAVHPWLVSLRGELIAALTTLYDQPLEPEVQLSVNSTALDDLAIGTEYVPSSGRISCAARSGTGGPWTIR